MSEEELKEVLNEEPMDVEKETKKIMKRAEEGIKKLQPKKKKIEEPKEEITNEHFMVEVLVNGMLLTRLHSIDPTKTIEKIYNSVIETDDGKKLKIKDAGVVSFNVVKLE